MVTTSFSAAQNLMTPIYRHLHFANLGQVCLFTLYAVICLTSLVSTYVSTKISIKTGLLGGASTYIIFILGGTLATYCHKFEDQTLYVCQTSFIYYYNVFAAGCLGVGAAFIWLSQGVYVNRCASEKTRGLFNGIFLSIMQFSQILGSTIAAADLGYTDEFTFYCILSCFAIIGAMMFVFLPDPAAYQEKEEEPQFMMTLQESLKSFLRTLISKKYYFLFIAMAFSGLGVAFYATYLSTAVETTISSLDHHIIERNISLVFLVLAIAEILAGISIGSLADKTNKVKLMGCTFVIFEGALLFNFLSLYMGSYNLSIVYGALFGYADTACNTMINVVIGSRFKASAELFSCYRFFQAIGCMIAASAVILVQKERIVLFSIMAGECCSCNYFTS